ncbi:MAG: PolC-type DNA polymerase III [Flammeovirgaceae bacterium]
MKNWFKSNTYSFPSFIEAYNQLDFAPAKQTPIEALQFIVLDCETTGLDKHDTLVSVGAVKVLGFSLEVSTVLNLKWESAPLGEATAIHEILSSNDGVGLEHKAQETLSFLGNAILVGHHVQFDQQKVEQAIAALFPNFRLKNRTLDTFHLMKRLFPNRMQSRVAGHDAFHLDALCKEFEIVVENRHTALGDAYLTAQLLMKLLYRLQKRGVHQAGDLLKKPLWGLG